jgi:hypothetical protein
MSEANELFCEDGRCGRCSLCVELPALEPPATASIARVRLGVALAEPALFGSRATALAMLGVTLLLGGAWVAAKGTHVGPEVALVPLALVAASVLLPHRRAWTAALALAPAFLWVSTASASIQPFACLVMVLLLSLPALVAGAWWARRRSETLAAWVMAAGGVGVVASVAVHLGCHASVARDHVLLGHILPALVLVFGAAPVGRWLAGRWLHR